MMTYLTHTLTTNLEHYLIILTSLAIVATSELMILEIIKQSTSKVKVFWPLLSLFTVINVVI